MSAAQQRRYSVAFYKTITDPHGQDREVCQRTVEVLAEGEDEALESAREEFCRLSGLTDWYLHADRHEISEVES